MSSAKSVLSDDEHTRGTCNTDNKIIRNNSRKLTEGQTEEDGSNEEGQDMFGDSDQDDLNDIINHQSDIIPSATRHSTDNCSFASSSRSKRVYKFTRQKKGNVVTRGMDFIRRMKWKSNGKQSQNRRLSQPDMDHWDGLFQLQSTSWSTQNTPRASIDSSNIPEDLIIPSMSTALNEQHQQNHQVGLPPIHEAGSAATISSSHHAYAEQYSRALHTPSRFLPQNQAVITTDVDGTILLFNDIASLCFKIDKSYVGQSILTTLLEDPFRKQITSILNRRKILRQQQILVPDKNKGLVLVCGTITPIIKSNGVKSVASLWLKEKNADSSNHIYIWIFEEIYETSLSVYVDSECIIRRVLGTMIEIYGYKEVDIVGKLVSCLVPALSKEQRNDNLEKIDRLKFFGSQSSQGISFPVILNLNRHVAIGDDDLASFVVKITSLPSIAGRMIVHIDSGLVKSISPVPAKYLFGRSVNTIVNLVHIRDLIPCLPVILSQLQPHTAVIQYQTCRRLLEKTIQQSAIYVVHRDGSQFEIELQLKRLDDGLVEIWITYDRMRATSKYEKRKYALVNKQIADLSLDKLDGDEGEANQAQNNKKRPAVRSLRISSFGAVNESRKLFPSTPKLDTEIDLLPSPRSPPTVNGVKKMHPLEDYVILDVLGHGTYGMAKLAYRKSDPFQKKLVIKYIIKSKIIVDSWIRDRELGSIPMEIHILRTLQKYPHVNCCRLVTSMEDEDYYFVVMELLGDGMDLFDYIELNSNISEQEIRTIFYQVARAVKHLHGHRIVHRDIKDENIILDQDGTVHLIDFGCAAYYKKDRKFDTFTGTLEYCAPEVLQGKPYEGPPQDIWATGILLFTLIYRENPFYNIDDIMEQDLRTPYIMSEDSLDLIRKMLERNVNKRITIDQVLAHPWLKGME